MPLERLFEDQVNSLREFLVDPGQTMRCLLTDAAMKQLLVRLFHPIDNGPEEPHVCLAAETPFTDTDQFFEALYDQLVEEHENGKAELDAAGIQIKLPGEEAGGLAVRQKFVRFIAALAE